MSSLSREEALTLVRQHVAKENNVKHMIAVGAVMHSLAKHLGQDAARWELTGILHDIDFEVCNGLCDHTLKAKEMLAGKVDDGIMKSILAHNFDNTKVTPDDEMSIGLIACDAVSGLVIACALVMPSKKLADVKPESLLKKFSNKDFAKGADRERMTYCQKLNVPLDRFLAIALEGMRERSVELGL
jgi:predicted hydrolase (HD superfamily)